MWHSHRAYDVAQSTLKRQLQCAVLVSNCQLVKVCTRSASAANAHKSHRDLAKYSATKASVRGIIAEKQSRRCILTHVLNQMVIAVSVRLSMAVLDAMRV